jgi:hypothetical protein
MIFSVLERQGLRERVMAYDHYDAENIYMNSPVSSSSLSFVCLHTVLMAPSDIQH